MMNADPFKSFYKMVHAGIFAHCARYMCERDDEEGPPPTAMALPHQQYRSVAGGSTTSSSRRSSSSNKRHHQQAPSESGGSRKSTKRSKGKSEAGGSTSGSSKSRRAHHHQHESQPSPVRIPTSPAEMSEDDLALLLVNPDTGRLLKESERALVPNYLPLSEDESVDEQQQQEQQQQQLQQQLMALMVTSADEEGAPPRLQSDAALISIRQTILVVAHRSRDSCLHAVVQTIRGNVLLHVFSPNNLVNAALQSYNDFVQERWIMRILRQYRLLLTLDEIEAAEYFRQQYFSGAPSGSPNQDIQMLSIVLSRAVNHACETLPIPRLRFCCKIMTVPGDVALLLLYPIHLDGSAYIMAEALKNLSGTLNVVLELTSVRIQQKLMNLHHHNLLSVFSHTISRMTPDGSVKGPGDAGPWLIETQRHKDKCEDEAVRLIARWHEENIRLRGMVQ